MYLAFQGPLRFHASDFFHLCHISGIASECEIHLWHHLGGSPEEQGLWDYKARYFVLSDALRQLCMSSLLAVKAKVIAFEGHIWRHYYYRCAHLQLKFPVYVSLIECREVGPPCPSVSGYILTWKESGSRNLRIQWFNVCKCLIALNQVYGKQQYQSTDARSANAHSERKEIQMFTRICIGSRLRRCILKRKVKGGQE